MSEKKDVKGLIKQMLQDIPHYEEFMTVEELNESSRKLAEKHPKVARLEEVGTSRTGEPIHALVIEGGEDKIVLAFGFPHPNEPIGSLALEFISWKLVKDEELLKALRATWIIVKVADVYGAKLNEGWFKGPFELRKYVLNYYRPPPFKQVEWTFPIEYKTLRWNQPVPETRALMKIIDEWRPTHIYSLHNAGFTGTYYYVTRSPGAEAMEIMREIPQELGVPLHKGEPETPYMQKLEEAIFKMPGTPEAYDWLEKHLGRDPAEVIKHGGSSYDYAIRVRPDVFELVCEVPYIYDNRLDVELRIGVPRREILRITIQRNRELLEELEKLDQRMSKLMDTTNPFYEAFAAFLEYSKNYLEAEARWVETDPQLDESATVAQAFDAYKNVLWSALFRYGLAYRAASYELQRGRDSELQELQKETLSKVDEYLAKVNRLIKYRVIPVRNLVSIQLAAMIATVASV